MEGGGRRPRIRTPAATLALDHTVIPMPAGLRMLMAMIRMRTGMVTTLMPTELGTADMAVTPTFRSTPGLAFPSSGAMDMAAMATEAATDTAVGTADMAVTGAAATGMGIVAATVTAMGTGAVTVTAMGIGAAPTDIAQAHLPFGAAMEEDVAFPAQLTFPAAHAALAVGADFTVAVVLAVAAAADARISYHPLPARSYLMASGCCKSVRAESGSLSACAKSKLTCHNSVWLMAPV